MVLRKLLLSLLEMAKSPTAALPVSLTEKQFLVLPSLEVALEPSCLMFHLTWTLERDRANNLVARLQVLKVEQKQGKGNSTKVTSSVQCSPAY